MAENKLGTWGIVFIVVLLGLFFYASSSEKDVFEVSPYCGDGVCNGDESFSNCPDDCVDEEEVQDGCDLAIDCDCETLVDSGDCTISGTSIGALLEDASTGCLVDADTGEVGISCEAACGCEGY